MEIQQEITSRYYLQSNKACTLDNIVEAKAEFIEKTAYSKQLYVKLSPFSYCNLIKDIDYKKLYMISGLFTIVDNNLPENYFEITTPVLSHNTTTRIK